MMYGQMTAGSWIYIGSQGIVQGTYETFVEVGPAPLRRRSRRPMDPDRRAGRHGRRAAAGRDDGRRVVPGDRVPGQSASRCACGPAISTRRPADLDEALAIIERSRRDRKPVSVGLLGNAAEVLPELVRRGVRPDVVTDQTSAHDPVNGYLPAGWTVSAMGSAARAAIPRRSSAPPSASMADARARDARVPQERACRPSTTATTSGRWPRTRASTDAFDFPGFVPAYIRPLFCRGIGPFRWVRAVGRSGGHLPHRREGESAAARRQASAQLARHGAERASASRACRRASAGSASATGTGWAWPSTRWWRAAN